jgi:hypothetical protein
MILISVLARWSFSRTSGQTEPLWRSLDVACAMIEELSRWFWEKMCVGIHRFSTGTGIFLQPTHLANKTIMSQNSPVAAGELENHSNQMTLTVGNTFVST